MAQHALIYSTRTKLRLLPLILVLLALVIFTLPMTKTGPIEDEISQAIDEGISISVPIDSCNNFRLKDFKAAGKWRKQFRKRGFTVDRVSEMLKNGTRERFIDKNGRSMMRIVDPISRDFIVVDPLTCEIWQIGPAQFLY